MLVIGPALLIISNSLDVKERGEMTYSRNITFDDEIASLLSH